MVKEKVKIINTWASNLKEIQEKVQEIENVDTIVMESATRHLNELDPDEIVKLANEAVEKCLVKAKTVVISTIIKRDDDKTACEKAENVNLQLF